MIGGKTEDILQGGVSQDYFSYESGNDTIANYNSWEDITFSGIYQNWTTEIDKLASSNKKLADAVDKFFEKVTNIDVRVNSIEYELRNIGSRLDKIESLLLKGDKQ